MAAHENSRLRGRMYCVNTVDGMGGIALRLQDK